MQFKVHISVCIVGGGDVGAERVCFVWVVCL